MITINVPNCNDISQSFYDSVINGLQLHQLSCSCGRSGCFSIHGYYERTVKLEAGCLRLKVCRVICSECGSTHALLPSCIVPYSQIFVSDHQKICSDYETGNEPFRICDTNPFIDENNVKYIIRRYKQYWRERLRSLRISLTPLWSLIQRCFADYSTQFMQIRRTFNTLYATPT